MSMKISAVDFFTKLGKTNVLNKNKHMPNKLSFKGYSDDPKPTGEGHYETIPRNIDWPEEVSASGPGYDVVWVPNNKPIEQKIPGS